jgi:predicted P-loop ATPase/GTPase
MPMKIHNEKVKDEVYECTFFYNQSYLIMFAFKINIHNYYSNNNKDNSKPLNRFFTSRLIMKAIITETGS